MINLKRILSILLTLIFIILLPVNQAFATDTRTTLPLESQIDDPEAPDIVSTAAIVMDATTGQILYAKNSYERMYPASITKIMTALVALEQGDLSSVITMSETAIYGIEPDSNHIALSIGEQITLEQALYAVMLVSANEAALGVAEHIGGSVEGFAELMNQKADELGCINTNFVNPNGLHDANHYTCAYDMALITKAAMANEQLVEIVSSTFYEIPPTNMFEEPRELYQSNRLIREGTEYYYEYCGGGKTGYTLAAQGTLACWAEKDGKKLIATTFEAGSNADNYNDSIKLFDYYFDNYSVTYPLEDYEFDAEQLTSAETHLNSFYGCKNLGTMKLETNLDAHILTKNDIDPSTLVTKVEFTTDQLEESIIGELTIANGDNVLVIQPIYYSGYINSEDEDAVRAAIAQGLIEDPNKKSNKPSVKLIIILILTILLVGAALAVLFRIIYIEKQRLAYKARRDQARKNQRPF